MTRKTFNKIESLACFNNHDEARHLLERLARQVDPIMKHRGWHVEKLLELDPSEPYLGLNFGRTYEISLKLRQPNDPDFFLEFHEILDTFLHELAHIKQETHTDDFYALWNELASEMNDYLEKGYFITPEGNVGFGHRLGGNHGVSEGNEVFYSTDTRKMALKAALARQQKRNRKKSLASDTSSCKCGKKNKIFHLRTNHSKDDQLFSCGANDFRKKEIELSKKSTSTETSPSLSETPSNNSEVTITFPKLHQTFSISSNWIRESPTLAFRKPTFLERLKLKFSKISLDD